MINREIKFRGKSKSDVWVSDGLWVYGYYVVKAGMPFIFRFGVMEPILVYPETVGQFTNRYDINGTPIYEDDILSNKNYKNNYKVKYMNGTLVLVEISNEEPIHIIDVSHYFGINYFEVIGNIHDNKEKLGNGKSMRKVRKNESIKNNRIYY